MFKFHKYVILFFAMFSFQTEAVFSTIESDLKKISEQKGFPSLFDWLTADCVKLISEFGKDQNTKKFWPIEYRPNPPVADHSKELSLLAGKVVKELGILGADKLEGYALELRALEALKNKNKELLNQITTLSEFFHGSVLLLFVAGYFSELKECALGKKFMCFKNCLLTSEQKKSINAAIVISNQRFANNTFNAQTLLEAAMNDLFKCVKVAATNKRLKKITDNCERKKEFEKHESEVSSAIKKSRNLSLKESIEFLTNLTFCELEKGTTKEDLLLVLTDSKASCDLSRRAFADANELRNFNDPNISSPICDKVDEYNLLTGILNVLEIVGANEKASLRNK